MLGIALIIHITSYRYVILFPLCKLFYKSFSDYIALEMGSAAH